MYSLCPCPRDSFRHSHHDYPVSRHLAIFNIFLKSVILPPILSVENRLHLFISGVYPLVAVFNIFLKSVILPPTPCLDTLNLAKMCNTPSHFVPRHFSNLAKMCNTLSCFCPLYTQLGLTHLLKSLFYVSDFNNLGGEIQ